MRNLVILLILLLILSGSCISYPQKTPEFVKRLNRINEILDEIDTDYDPLGFLYSLRSNARQAKKNVAENEKCCFLIENSDIALPLMFKRLNNKKLDLYYYKVGIYFIVFERAKSAESLPYIADYLESVSEETRADRIFECAISAAQEIIHPLELIYKKYSPSALFDQRLNIANQLRQFLSRGCVSNSPQQPTDAEIELKRLNRINEILDEIEKAPWSKRFLAHPSVYASGPNVYSSAIARKTEARFLIENSDIALPLMFKRLDSKKATGGILIVYFIVFEHTKSAESIPYLADYISSLDEGHKEFAGLIGFAFTYAIMAAQTITSLTSLKQLRNNSPWSAIFDRRSDIVNWLRQWYEEYARGTHSRGGNRARGTHSITRGTHSIGGNGRFDSNLRRWLPTVRRDGVF